MLVPLLRTKYLDRLPIRGGKRQGVALRPLLRPGVTLRPLLRPGVTLARC